MNDNEQQKLGHWDWDFDMMNNLSTLNYFQDVKYSEIRARIGPRRPYG